MNHDTERKYFVEKIMDFLESLEDEITDLHHADENRVLFRLHGRPFEILAWINEDSDMVCVTTRTMDLEVNEFDVAVKRLQNVLETCWEYCVAVSRTEARYDLSMAIFVGGFNFEAFEAVIHNLMTCAMAIEKHHAEVQEESDGEQPIPQAEDSSN